MSLKYNRSRDYPSADIGCIGNSHASALTAQFKNLHRDSGQIAKD